MSRTVPAASLTPYAELLDALAGLTWPSSIRVRAGDPGSHRSSRLGASPEFTEYRAYRQGDDLRRLDWKLYGRTDRPFLRIADDHAALRTMLLIDASASMRFPVQGYGKWKHACAIALGLASVAIADGDAVGIVVRDRVIPPRRRRDLLNDAALLFETIEPAGSVSIGDAVSRFNTTARLVVISDFLGDSEEALPALRVAAAGGSEIFAIHVVAQAELTPDERSFLAADPERPDFQRTLSATNRGAYLEAFAAWRGRVANQLHAMNARHVLTSTSDPVRDVVRRIVLG